MTEPSRARGQSAASALRPADGAVLVLLSLAAGCVDAVSFLGLGQVLTAAMTGNTVLLGLALGQAELQAALRSVVALLGFFIGVLLGASIVQPVPGRLGSAAVAAALAIELALLLVLAVAWQLADGDRWVEIRLALIAMAGLAMGIQSAIAHRIGIAGIATTYVTGTLTTIGTRLVAGLRGAWRGEPAQEGKLSWLPAMAWIAYGIGAVLAGATYHWWPPVATSLGIGREVRWSSAALLLPLVVVATVMLMVALGHRRPAAHA